MFVSLQIGEKIVTPRVRLFEPLNLMKKLYNVEYEIIDNSVRFKSGEDLFVMRSRIWSDSIRTALRIPIELHNKNYATIYEMDDSVKIFKGFEDLKYADLIASHAVTCSTEPLAEELREFNPFVKIFKNQIANLMPEKEFEEKDHVTIFFGALNREQSWQDIMPILNKLAKKYGNKLHFMVISDVSFFESLETPHKLFALDKKMNTNQFVSFDIYMEQLRKADIALLPLSDTPFNRKKSDLKFIESGNAMTAVIASPTVYESSIKDGETGFIYRTPREFQAKLNILIKDKAKRVEMAKNAYEYVKRERLLKDHIKERYDWMREVYAKREELHAALLKRIEKFN